VASTPHAAPAWAGYPWREIFGCAAIWGAASFVNALFGYAIPGMIAEYGVSVAVIGLIISASFLFSALAAGTAGFLADSLGHTRIIAVCLALAVVLTALIGVVPGIVLIGLLRILSTGMGGALGPLTGGYVANLLPANKRPLGVAIVQCGFPLGWALAAALVAPLIITYGWRAVFLAALPALLVVPFVGRLLPARKPAAAPEDQPPAGRVRIGELYRGPVGKRAMLVAAGFFCYAFAYGGSAFYIPAYLQQSRGYDAAGATMLVGITYAVGTTGYIAAAIVGQTLLDRRQTAQLWCLLGGIAFVSFVWFPQTPLHDLLLFGTTAFFFYGTGSVLFTVASEIFPPEVRTTGIALSASLGVNGGFALAPTITGALIEAIGWREAFTAASVPLIVTVTCLALLGPHFSHDEGGKTDGQA
jgi:MFS transporter, putative metabolite:H+ symporter